MSIFIPPLSLSKYAEFVQDSSSSTGYDTFQAEADSTPIEGQYWEDKIAPMLDNIANLARSSTELMKRAWLEASTETLGLRDDKNYLGFRMAMRISKSIKVNPIGSSNSLEINIETSTNPLVVWKEDIAAQPRSIKSSNEFGNEIFNQDQLGDFFILRYFIHHWKWFTDSERVAFTSNAFNIWNAIQIPLAEVVFSAKSKNKGFLRPCELDAKKYPVKHGLKIPPHNTFPSGHAAGAGALAGLLYFLAISARKDPAVGEKFVKASYRIGLLREYANLHWTEDTQVGFMVGLRFTKAVIELASSSTNLDDLKWLTSQCVDGLMRTKP